MTEASEKIDKVYAEVDKVITKFTGISEHATKLIQNEISSLEQLRSTLAEMDSDTPLTPQQLDTIKGSLDRIKEKLNRLSTEHKDLHGTVSKVGKAIDRNFYQDYTSIAPRLELFQEDRNINLLNQIIAKHFYRSGMTDVAECLVAEGDISKSDISEEPFARFYSIYEEILRKNLQPAIEWVTSRSEDLKNKNSSIEFKLHKLAFLQIIVNGGIAAQNEAIYYARAHLSKFIDHNCFSETSKYLKEFQALMGCLLFLKVGIENSPYKQFLREEMWVEAADVFLKDSCDLLGINKDSSLSVIVNAGCVSMPALLNLKQVMARNVQGIWTGRDELPIEIDVERKFHSIFACPILKQQSTEENPPMKLKCGHVISRDALMKLSSNSMMNNNQYRALKCPYCPLEQSINDAKQIFF